MGFFSVENTKVIAVDDENTVTIRRLTYGESQDVINESTQFDVLAESGKFDFAVNQAAKLKRAVVSWDGPGWEGRPVTLENILALPADVGRIISDAVDKLNTGLSESERKKSVGSTSTP